MKTSLFAIIFLLSQVSYAIKVSTSEQFEVSCVTPANMSVESSARVNGVLQIVGTNPNSSESLEGTLEVILGSDANPDFYQKDIFVKAVRMPNNSIQAFAMNAGLSMIYMDGSSSYVEIGNKSYKMFCEIVIN